jgi:prepilin-type N-terminal cleavage/methylation domain-containing protein
MKIGPETTASTCPRHPAGSCDLHVARRRVRRSGDPAGCRGHVEARRGFTLIEIMVAIGIIAIILSIAIPSVYQQMHKDSMRQAVSDLTEACTAARARAILNGVATEIRIRPGDRTVNVIESAAPISTPEGGSIYRFENDQLVEKPAGGGGSVFSAKLSDSIFIEFIGVNLIDNLQQQEEVTSTFYPNGTADELVVLIRSDRGEIRKITTEVVTGQPDVEVIK